MAVSRRKSASQGHPTSGEVILHGSSTTRMFQRAQYALKLGGTTKLSRSRPNNGTGAYNFRNFMEQRKPIRLTDYDYSQNGVYFVTVCAQNRRCIFWKSGYSCSMAVGADIIRPKLPLSHIGKIVDEAINQVSVIYPSVFVDNYVVMPNHVHLLLTFDNLPGRIISAPTLSTVVGQMKRAASKKAGFSLWQKSFYDHVVRNQQDYGEIWRYITENPISWDLDTLYSNQ